MGFSLGRIFENILLMAPPILLALTVHEASHALVAWLRGDPTAKNAGRLSLNPLRHLDLMGTVAFFVTALLGAGIGWAKPVPVNLMNLKDPRRDNMWISAAGPVSNFATAAALALLFYFLVWKVGLFQMEGWQAWKGYLARFLIYSIYINVTLAFFNLIPLPPLDGSGILTGLLPPAAAAKYQRIGGYGFFIIMGLIFLPTLVPGAPDFIHTFVVTPAQAVTNALLPWLGGV